MSSRARPPPTGRTPSPASTRSSSSTRAARPEAEGRPPHERRLPARERRSTMKYVFDLKESDVYFCTADVGWVTGHSYVVYGPLSAGATVLMYEGAPNHPEPDRFWAADRPAQRDHPVHRADGHPRLHALGRRLREPPQPRLAPPPRLRRRADQSRRRGCGTTRSSARSAARSSTRGGRRRPGPSW